MGTSSGSPAASGGGSGGGKGRFGMRVLFLLTVAAAFIILPMRHVVVVSSASPPRRTPPTEQPANDGHAFVAGDVVHGSGRPAGAENAPTVDAAGDAPGDGTSDGAKHSPAVDEVHRYTDAPTGRVSAIGEGERSGLLRELRVDLGQLPKPRNDSLQQPAELGAAEAGGIYRNPYAPMEQSARPCTNGRHAVGRWVRDPSRKPPYPSVGEILGSCQRGWEAKHGPGAVRPETQYRWVPDTCDLIPFSEEKFCKALRGRDIMFAGDSLNDHWHASLVYLLGLMQGKDIYKKEGTVQRKRACQTHAICHKYYARPLKLYFLTNQLLQQTSMRNRNHKWWKHIRQYSLLVLNAGSWMRDPTNEEREVSDAEYEGHMKHALKLVRGLFNGTVVWRTTYQGHPYCWTYNAPLTAELKAEDFPVVPPYKRYRWAAIPGRNAVSTKLWREAGAHILDITRPTNLMPLGHLGQNHPKFALRNTTDCLHYCAPGPYDTWSEMLMNLLLGNLGP